MTKLRLIPLALTFLCLTYLGVSFVDANRQEVVLSVWSYQSKPSTLGFIVMTSVLFGLLMGTIIWSVEVFYLVIKLRSAQKKLMKLESGQTKVSNDASDYQSSQPGIE